MWKFDHERVKDNLADINYNCLVAELFEATNNTSGTYFLV